MRLALRAAVLGSASLLIIGPAAAKSTISTFDVPGATSTQPSGINTKGQITGSYVDSSGVTHGFVRANNGKITTFDAPGSPGTTATAINDNGLITGYVSNIANSVGFIRSANGANYTTFSLGNYGYTFPYTIDSYGDVGGTYYYMGYGYAHHRPSNGSRSPGYNGVQADGFVRDANGTVHAVVGEGLVAPNNTYVTQINENGIWAAKSTDSIGDTFCNLFNNATGVCNPAGTDTALPTGLNDSNQLSGSFHDAKGWHGYTENTDGSNYVTIDVAGATATYTSGINQNGVISGNYTDSGGISNGFVRAANLKISKFNVNGQNTTTVAINSGGTVTGYYTDSSGNNHGFVYKPN